MSLDVALNAAVSGLKANQEVFGIISQNIANVNTDKYARRVVDLSSTAVDGVGQGVQISGVMRKIDGYLVGLLRSQNTTIGYHEVLTNYYDTIENYFGKPNDPSNIISFVDDFFSSLKSLVNNPELPSLRINAISNGERVADKISDLAFNIQNLRYGADKEIKTSIDDLNNNLEKLHNINIALGKSTGSDASNVSLQEDRDKILEKISGIIDITSFTKGSGQVYVSTTTGISLLDENRYLVEYNAATNIDAFTKQSNLNSVDAFVYNALTGDKGASRELISSGLNGDDITTNLKGGKLLALQKMRDIILPDMLKQVDNLAVTLRDEFNKIHNNGSGYPAAESLTGTRSIIDSERKDWEGQVRIAVLNKDGTPISQTSGEYLNAKLLDLSQLSSGVGGGAGQPTVQTIVDEINEHFYYEPTVAKVKLGDLNNIRLNATSNFSAVPNGQVSFDFEADNSSQTDSQFEVLSVSVTDGGAAGLVSPLPGLVNVVAGTYGKVSAPITINFAGGSGGPYTVQAQVKVTDAEGNVSVSTIEYVINDNPGSTDALNNRYYANAASGDGTIIPAGTTQRFMKAEIVDENGAAVSSGSPGYLRLKTQDSDYRIVISELTSKEKGISFYSSPYTVEQKETGMGFSQYFGLNDFFVNSGSDKSNTYGAAVNMKVRDDIITNPSLISVAELAKTSEYYVQEVIGKDTAGAVLEFNNNPAIGDTITINGTLFNFVAAAAADDEITVGGTLAATLTNMVTKLNTSNTFNAGTVDKIIYTDNGSNTLTMTAKAAGSKANTLNFSGNFAIAGVSVNSNPATLTPSGNLVGGTDETKSVLKKPNTYEVTTGNNIAIKKLADLYENMQNYSKAGTMPGISATIVGYLANVVSFNSAKISNERSLSDNENMIFEGYQNRFESASGVNLDEELANTVIYQNAYSASARIVKVTKELFDTLISAT